MRRFNNPSYFCRVLTIRSEKGMLLVMTARVFYLLLHCTWILLLIRELVSIVRWGNYGTPLHPERAQTLLLQHISLPCVLLMLAVASLILIWRKRFVGWRMALPAVVVQFLLAGSGLVMALPLLYKMGKQQMPSSGWVIWLNFIPSMLSVTTIFLLYGTMLWLMWSLQRSRKVFSSNPRPLTQATG